MKVLAIETSFDETAVALVEKSKNGLVKVLSEPVESSMEEHAKTGGAVPEVAARRQMESMLGVIKVCLKNAGAEDDLVNWAKENVGAIAVTRGPGLIGSLLVGVETAKTLALAWEKPLIGVNHMWGHLYANWVEKDRPQVPGSKYQEDVFDLPEFPAVGLIVSGGHTDLVLMKDHGELEIIGQTLDDAAGECFDKCARLMGLGFPGGPAIAACAAKYKKEVLRQSGVLNNNRSAQDDKVLPRPMLHSDDFNMSFSGLKTAVLNEVRKIGELKESDVERLAYELQEAIVEVLVNKSLEAIKKNRPKSFLLCGGVAANVRLREELRFKIQDLENEVDLFVPEIKYCTDNAVMIGAAAIFNGSPIPIGELKADPGLEVVE